MKNMQKFTILSILTIFLFLTLSSVSAELVVTNQNTTAQINSVVNSWNNDHVILEGEFRNLSTITITTQY
ncbi:hypothetical protein ALNOE001_08450 [Candidatus Methanobinarius endosymbioticus]|uniref:Uncharacterized protein n=1 Tax=Candidatus Methanobinarius endosymbioticus TaxID=2006182 RepID=A0A366MBJ6_9EURY|nr:hypothetical protein ALNOE001_08450 [Candidatus Methanobinarius endosymbioticus]